MNKSIIVIGWILAVLVVSGCVGEQFIEQKTCEDYAIELVPDEIYLFEESGVATTSDFFIPYTNENGFWKDGTNPVQLIDDYYIFTEGNLEGENVGLYYYRSESISKYKASEYGFVYKTSNFLSEDGTVLGFRAFAIRPILKKKHGTGKFFATGLSSSVFEIVEPNFLYCKWVTDDGEVIGQF